VGFGWGVGGLVWHCRVGEGGASVSAACPSSHLSHASVICHPPPSLIARIASYGPSYRAGRLLQAEDEVARLRVDLGRAGEAIASAAATRPEPTNAEERAINTEERRLLKALRDKAADQVRAGSGSGGGCVGREEEA
jgi:hypothetical protein